jgi:hypothetical protein
MTNASKNEISMKSLFKILVIAFMHAFFMFWAYGSGFLRLFPYNFAMFIWLAGSSAVAFVAYDRIFSKSRWPLAESKRKTKIACALLTLFSFCLGGFWAFNTYGT